jgi:large subunit ribosomal protein L10
MTKEEKAKKIDELTEKFSNHAHFYITDAGGFTVAEVNAFRRICYNSGIEYRVYKNTLIQKALEKSGTTYEPLFEILKGSSGVIFSKEVGNAPARAIKESRVKVSGKPLLKAASIGSDLYIGDENLNMLSELKSKNELIGDVIALLQSPAKKVLSALLGSKHKLAGLVKTLEERK